jgi:hydroxyethylthiazole kinase-like uncharacterized protein yjeF
MRRALQTGMQYTLAADGSHSWWLPSSEEMAELDRLTIQNGIDAMVLMERAGGAIAEQIVANLPSSRRCVVLCGPGNNGGDGLVIARLLRARGFQVSIVLVKAQRYSRECGLQLSKTEDIAFFSVDAGASDGKILSGGDVEALLTGADCVVDALLGTGQRKTLRGEVRELVSLVVRVKQRCPHLWIVAVDIPTGLDADTGEVFVPCVPADFTPTVQYIKRGMLAFPGRAMCGKISAVAIGIDAEVPVEFGVACEGNVRRRAARASDVHKGMLGRVLVIGGSLEMPGAPILASMGALRAGAGIVARCVHQSWLAGATPPEAMLEVIAGDTNFFTGHDLSDVLKRIRRFDSVIVGPGMGTAPETGAFLEGLFKGIREESISVVIDADALNLIASQGISIEGVRAVITPHPGEASRLLGIQTSEVQRDRFTAVRELARKYGVIAVLKGAGTVVHDGSRGILVTEGTPFLATPGSGDVLSGIIAASISSSTSLFDAGVRGVWLHAVAGMRASEMTGGTILASDIALAVSQLAD